MTFMIEMGDPVLRQKAAPIADVFSAETKATIDTMIKALIEQKGIGIAAPQVGVAKQIFIVAPNQKIQLPYDNIDTGLVVINPSISFNTKKITHEWEGCLSVPGIRGYVPRQCDITINYTNYHGEIRSESYDGFTARIFLHEYDHLSGTLFLDRIENLKDHLITDAYYKQLLEEEEQ